MSAPTKDGGPAFPVPEGNGCGPWGGMSLRAYFAGQAIAGLMSQTPIPRTPQAAAKIAISVADALIAELEART